MMNNYTHAACFGGFAASPPAAPPAEPASPPVLESTFWRIRFHILEDSQKPETSPSSSN